MNGRLLLMGIYLPEFLKRQQLLELHWRSVAALGCVPCTDAAYVRAESYQKMLAMYAAFTNERAQTALDGGADTEVLSNRLRREAEKMGRSLRQRLRIRRPGEFRTALRLIYRALGIDLQISAQGEVKICSCYFSGFYSAPVCRLMSALDDGLVQGLSGGGRLRFTRRLTEGASCCRAVVEWPKNSESSPPSRKGCFV